MSAQAVKISPSLRYWVPKHAQTVWSVFGHVWRLRYSARMARPITYNVEEMKHAVNDVLRGATLLAAATEWKVPRSTLSRIVAATKAKSSGVARECKRKTGDALSKAKAKITPAKSVDLEAGPPEGMDAFTFLATQITHVQGRALATLVEALTAERYVGADDEGPVFAPDWAVRTKAADSILDRGGMLPKIKTVRAEDNDLPKMEPPEVIRQRIADNRRHLILLNGDEDGDE